MVIVSRPHDLVPIGLRETHQARLVRLDVSVDGRGRFSQAAGLHFRGSDLFSEGDER